jgi:hypothetical protein
LKRLTSSKFSLISSKQDTVMPICYLSEGQNCMHSTNLIKTGCLTVKVGSSLGKNTHNLELSSFLSSLQLTSKLYLKWNTIATLPIMPRL